jgi:hypothetical protein
MRIKALLLAALLPGAAAAADWSLTVLPNASVRYRGEGKVLPQSYANRADGMSSPVYRLEISQPAAPEGSWSLALWHTGVFGGGAYAAERVPDESTGGTYQTNRLNVGFTNIFVTRRRPLWDGPVDALVSVSVVRQIFKRKGFVIQGKDAGSLDDVNEISAEGLGFGLAGLHPIIPRQAQDSDHSGSLYFRWQASAHQYIQLFDAKTDSSAGQIFQAESGLGLRLGEGVTLEGGWLWQYWFTHSQGDRRIAFPGTAGAVISWNRQETRASGAYLRLEKRFAAERPSSDY